MILIALGILAVGFLVILLFYLAFRMVTVRGRITDYTTAKIPHDHPLAPFRERLYEAGKNVDSLKPQMTELTITSFDGLRLYADYLPNGDSKKTVIMMHGYRSTCRGDFGAAVPFYRSQGFNILMVDQRCHGRSEGRYITYGIYEKYDCRDWVNKILTEFGHDTQILLAGLSMGASTALMTSGLDLPDNVKAISADCGYTSPWEIVLNTAKGLYRFIPTAALHVVNFCCRIFADFDLHDDNTLVAMQKTTIPIIFAHGTRDHFVPYEMTLRNHATCRSEKELLRVVGAEHGTSFLQEEEHYTAVFSRFLSKYFSN